MIQNSKSGRLLEPVSNISEIETWSCHCCTAKNSSSRKICSVCGRPENYVQHGQFLPLHGMSGSIYRPSQISGVVEDINQLDSEHWTALHSACAMGNYPNVKKLIECGADVNALTLKGQAPLHLAIHGGSLECVTELIRSGAEVNSATSVEMNSPLHAACQGGLAKIANLLIRNGAEVNALNILERTPLHCAATTGRKDLALLLVRSGARAAALDVHGWDACQIAELFGHRDFEEILIRHNMTEKQAVIKNLPPAKWHGSLWDDMVRMQQRNKLKYEGELQQKQALELHVEALHRGVVNRAMNERKEERQREIDTYRSLKLPAIYAYKKSITRKNPKI